MPFAKNILSQVDFTSSRKIGTKPEAIKIKLIDNL